MPAQLSFDPAEIRDILLADETSSVVARRYGCSACTIRAIRTGRNHSHVHPEIPRDRNWFRRRLTDEQVMEVLRSDMSARWLAKELGVATTIVNDIRRGRIYCDVLPDVPRRVPNRTCQACQHCIKGEKRLRCDLGFPDIKEDGPRAAVLCNCYREAK